MGSLFACFRSRLPPPLTSKEIELIQKQSDLTADDIRQWYDRFIHCYPHGYLSENEFIIYYQQLHDEYSLQLKPLIKELFTVFDLNKNGQLDFEEFLLLNILTNDGSIDEKVQLIFGLFEKEKEKVFSRNDLKEFLRNIFDLFDIQLSKTNLIHVIDSIFQQNNLTKDQQISWKLFTEQILNQPSLYHKLIAQDFQQNRQIIQRSERF